jgi:ATP-dependent RNA helicase DDX54/DBP10
MQLHPLFGDDVDNMEQARVDMLARISGFKPNETIFEIGIRDKGINEAAEMMRGLRSRIKPKNRVKIADKTDILDEDEHYTIAGNGKKTAMDSDEDSEDDEEMEVDVDQDEDDDDDLQVTVSNDASNKKGRTDWRDQDVFMSYTPRTTNAAEERGYGVHSGGAGSSFVEATRDVTMDLANDDSGKSFGQPARAKMRWDAKSKKYVSRENDEDGSKGAKMITGESGVKIAASFQSGRYDKWKRAQRIGKLPRVGETERPGAGGALSTGGPGAPGSGPRYRHKQEKAPKEADKYRDDFQARKKRVAEARDKRVGRFKDGMGSKKELKGMTDIRKAREEKERKRAKNARPTRRK